MDKNKAINKITELKEKALSIINLASGNHEFKKWFRNSEIAIEKVFGKDKRHLNDFREINFYPVVWTADSDSDMDYSAGISDAIALFDSFIDEINNYWEEEPRDHFNFKFASSQEKIENLILRFHLVARQLQRRYSKRDTIEINDEYDVQDLIHALLNIYFDDIVRGITRVRKFGVIREKNRRIYSGGTRTISFYMDFLELYLFLVLSRFL